jgi:hypothetical protein
MATGVSEGPAASIIRVSVNRATLCIGSIGNLDEKENQMQTEG